MTIVTTEAVAEFRERNTRDIEMPDGTKRAVRMTPELWNSLEFILEIEELNEPQIATFALEEMTLQDVSFDRAFRGIVAHLANRWK